MRNWALAVATLMTAAAAEAAPAPWLEVKSAHFTVITDAGEKRGRRTAWQFEQIRSALVTIWPWAKIDSGRPFVVFAARDEDTLKTLGPEYWEGKRFRPVAFGSQGRDRQFIALRTDAHEPDEVGANPYQAAYWSYVSAVFNRSFPRRVPAWYGRGIAEVMSNTIVRDKVLHVGRPTRYNVDLVRERPPVPLSELLSADHGSPWLTQERDVSVFDANAWALVHYLVFGEQGAHSAKVDQFNRLLYAGKDPKLAVQEAFGDMRPYHDGMRGYVQRSLFVYASIPVTLDTRPEAYAVRPLPAAEAAVLRGELLVAMDRPVEARAFAAEAAKVDPSLPGPWEIEADLLDREDRRDEAKAAYARAAAAGSKRAHVHYRLAQLEWSPNADKALQERLAVSLEKARALEPESASTLSFLAGLRAQLGQPEEALTLAKKAVEIEPAESYHRLALARTLWALQRPDEAVKAAQSALQAADGESERKSAQDFLDVAARASRAQAPTASTEPASAGASASVPETLADVCRGGDKADCAHIALDQARGEIPGDRAKARSTLETLCKEGVDDGCIGWAIVLASTSRPAQIAKARQLLQATCDRRNEDACSLLKSMPR